MSTTVVASGPDWQILWDGCVQCGAPTLCPQWIVASASAGRPVLSCELYPCFCLATRASAPDWVEEATCWWRSKKTGRLDSRCPCWGRQHDDRLPKDCCSWHEANPAYVVEHLEAGIRGPDVPTQHGGNAMAGEAPDRTATAGTTGEAGTSGPMASYTRLWPPSEVTCDCPTPWDGSKTVGGYHCSSCHTNWVNVATAMVHQRHITDQCRDPRSIVDVDTGRPPLYARDVRGAMVWAFAW